LWFVAVDERGRRIAFGRVPQSYTGLVGALGTVSTVYYAQLRDSVAPYALSAVIRRATGPAGKLTIIAHGKLTTVNYAVAAAANIVIIPIGLLLGLATMIATPWMINRSLAGVGRIAREAEQIDVDRRGLRLTATEVPRELSPLVDAVNQALARLDEGYEQQRRFIASAAHELRTPIAILRAKAEAAGDDALTADIARLSNLAEQLLDLQRLDSGVPHLSVDLARLAQGVVADLAPLLIAAGKSVELVVEPHEAIVGDAGALERVVTNLIQNAVGHGGENAIVRVFGHGLEVSDDGPGIPVDERERVFEPFHRLTPRQTGAGLGLNLVRQVVDWHRGEVRILEAAGGGAIIRILFTKS
jgi:two-component system sensor histidine kinase TctE